MRYYYNSKATANESCDLNIYRLKKQGMLSGNAYMPITWESSATGKETTIGLTVDITTDHPYSNCQLMTGCDASRKTKCLKTTLKNCRQV